MGRLLREDERPSVPARTKFYPVIERDADGKPFRLSFVERPADWKPDPIDPAVLGTYTDLGPRHHRSRPGIG